MAGVNTTHQDDEELDPNLLVPDDSSQPEPKNPDLANPDEVRRALPLRMIHGGLNGLRTGAKKVGELIPTDGARRVTVGALGLVSKLGIDLPADRLKAKIEGDLTAREVNLDQKTEARQIADKRDKEKASATTEEERSKAEFEGELAQRENLANIAIKVLGSDTGNALLEVTKSFDLTKNDDDSINYAESLKKLYRESSEIVKAITLQLQNKLKTAIEIASIFHNNFAHANLISKAQFQALQRCNLILEKLTNLGSLNDTDDFFVTVEQSEDNLKLSNEYIDETGKALQAEAKEKSLYAIQTGSAFGNPDIAEKYRELSDMPLTSDEQKLAFAKQAAQVDEEMKHVIQTGFVKADKTLDEIFVKEDGIFAQDTRRKQQSLVLQRKFQEKNAAISKSSHYLSAKDLQASNELIDDFADILEVLSQLQADMQSEINSMKDDVKSLLDNARIGAKRLSKEKILSSLRDAYVVASLPRISTSNDAKSLMRSYKEVQKITAALEDYHTRDMGRVIADAALAGLDDVTEAEIDATDKLAVKIFTKAKEILGEKRTKELEETYKEMDPREQIYFLEQEVMKELSGQRSNVNTEISRINSLPIPALVDEIVSVLKIEKTALDPSSPHYIKNLEGYKAMLIRQKTATLGIAGDISVGQNNLSQLSPLEQEAKALRERYEVRTKATRDKIEKAGNLIREAMAKVKSSDDSLTDIKQNWENFGGKITELYKIIDELYKDNPEQKAAVKQQIEESLNPRNAERLAEKQINKFLELHQSGNLTVEQWRAIHASVKKLDEGNFMISSRVLRWSHYIQECDPNSPPRMVPSETALQQLYFWSGKTSQMQKLNSAMYESVVKGKAEVPAELGRISQFMEDKLGFTFGISDTEARLQDIKRRTEKLERSSKDTAEKLNNPSLKDSKRKSLQAKKEKSDMKLAKLKQDQTELERSKGTERAYKARLGALATSRSQFVDAVMHPNLYGIVENLPLTNKIKFIVPHLSESSVATVNAMRDRDSIKLRNITRATANGVKEIIPTLKDTARATVAPISSGYNRVASLVNEEARAKRFERREAAIRGATRDNVFGRVDLAA